MTPTTLPAAAAANIIRPGDILHVRTHTPLSWAIRRSVHSWGCHDALVVFKDNRLQIGDASPMKCHCTPLETWQARFDKKACEFFVCRPVSAGGRVPPLDDLQGHMAAQWWLANVQGKPYDFGAYPRLFAKAILGDLCQRAAGWKWAWYCTESCRDAWLAGAGVDIYGKTNPTPRTTEKRILSGTMEIVWNPMPNFTLTSQKSVVSSQKSEVSIQNLEFPPSDFCLLNPDSSLPPSDSCLLNPDSCPTPA